MILQVQTKPIIRLLLCSVFILYVTSALATNNITTVKSLFEVLPPNLGEMQVTPNRIPSNQTTLVTATLRIQYDYKPETVILRRLDNSTQHAVAKLATFHDDGEQGDNIADDGVYTAQIMLSAVHPDLIKLDALASFKNADEQQQLTSLWAGVTVKKNIVVNQVSVIVDGTRVVFRDKNGHTVREESDQINRESSKNTISAVQSQTEQVFKQQTAITSPDQNFVGIIGSLQPANTIDQPINEENSNIAGWEFRYQNISGTLWTKTINSPRRFYLPDSASLISDDGSRILLVETTENYDEPSFTVYDQAGTVLLKEKIPLYSLYDARISENGNYVLFNGLPTTPKLDYASFVVINVQNPSQRWIESFRGSRIVAEEINNNAQGGFDILLNHQKRYSFPK